MKNDRADILLEYSKIARYLDQFRKAKKKIVLTQGSFDMVHIGHARYCDKAKSFGDVLIVGVDSDEKVRLRKGPDRPIVPQVERMEMLSYLKPVDLVVLKDVKEPKYQLIKLVQPDVLVATKETYTTQALEELKKYCKEVIVLDPMATTSTSAKIRLVQIGAANRISSVLSEKLIKTIEEVLQELKGSD